MPSPIVVVVMCNAADEVLGHNRCSYTVTLTLLAFNGSIMLLFRSKQPLKARTNALYMQEAFASKYSSIISIIIVAVIPRSALQDRLLAVIDCMYIGPERACKV
jgi:hypothetical protein